MTFIQDLYNSFKTNKEYKLTKKEYAVFSDVMKLMSKTENGPGLLFSFTSAMFASEDINKTNSQEMFDEMSDEFLDNINSENIPEIIYEYIKLMKDGKNYTYNLHMSLAKQFFMEMYGSYLDEHNSLVDLLQANIIAVNLANDFFIDKYSVFLICIMVIYKEGTTIPLAATFRPMDDSSCPITMYVKHEERAVYVITDKENFKATFDNIRDTDGGMIEECDMSILRNIAAQYIANGISGDINHDNMLNFIYSKNDEPNLEYDGAEEDINTIMEYLNDHYPYYNTYLGNNTFVRNLIQMSSEMIGEEIDLLEVYLADKGVSKSEFFIEYKLDPIPGEIFFKLKNFNIGLMNFFISVCKVRRGINENQNTEVLYDERDAKLKDMYTRDRKIISINSKYPVHPIGNN